MAGNLKDKLKQALGAAVTGSRPMRGGDIADVSLLTLADGRTVVAKRPRADQPDTTALEALMLRHLKAQSALPVPDVLFQADGILVISHVPHRGCSNPAAAARDIARHVSALHKTLAPQSETPFGFECDTVIGPLPQPNGRMASWADFFRDRRLMPMAQSCARTRRLPAETMARIERLAAKLPDLIPAKPPASLLHGDLWAGNILIDGDRAAGFIDPAISYGDREMDLAFIALMGGLDPAFFEAYAEAHAIESGYFETRQYIYQLWPLLVHVRLFGGGYVAQVEGILDRLGL